jgi:prolyl-tRNA editing enzyme YbaK/EbsC (Cys-tRNA(Pro) deacylase)
MAEVFTPQHVQAALDTHGYGIQIRLFETTTATSQQAADNIGCALGQIAKSICFFVKQGDDETPVLVVTGGDQRVDDRKIAALYGVGRKQVRTATPDDCVNVFGYAPGSVPPLAHRQPIRTFVDQSFERFEMLYAAGGAHNAIFPITLAQLLTITGGTLADVLKEATA